jgi:hypothetical protein
VGVEKYKKKKKKAPQISITNTQTQVVIIKKTPPNIPHQHQTSSNKKLKVT